MTTYDLHMTIEEEIAFNRARKTIFLGMEEYVISAYLSDLSYNDDLCLTARPMFILVVNDMEQGMTIAEAVYDATNGRFSAYPVLHEHFDADINKGIPVL